MHLGRRKSKSQVCAAGAVTRAHLEGLWRLAHKHLLILSSDAAVRLEQILEVLHDHVIFETCSSKADWACVVFSTQNTVTPALPCVQ